MWLSGRTLPGSTPVPHTHGFVKELLVLWTKSLPNEDLTHLRVVFKTQFEYQKLLGNSMKLSNILAKLLKHSLYNRVAKLKYLSSIFLWEKNVKYTCTFWLWVLNTYLASATARFEVRSQANIASTHTAALNTALGRSSWSWPAHWGSQSPPLGKDSHFRGLNDDTTE